MNIVTAGSAQNFTELICETIKEEADKRIAEKGSFTFVLSGGRTPKVIFQELAENYQKSISWEKVHFFWVDERCVPPTHQDSNYRLAYDCLISKLGRVGSVHRIQGELVPDQAASIYEQEIIDFFEGEDVKFDFILLGMGEDGHVASIFPDCRQVEVNAKLVFATSVCRTGYYRVSMGWNLLNAGLEALLMIKGKLKMEILTNNDNTLPIKKINITKVIYV